MTLLAGGVAVIVTPQAAALRRNVGAVAWAVFEDVALESDGRCAHTSARRVADRLGITATSAAAALAKLRRCHLVTLKRASGDRFGLSTYALAPAEGVILVDVVVATLSVENVR